MNETANIVTDPKRIRILEGALQVFLAYGFARTTMDDIARAADMSRPALYLLFTNKTDIYRSTAMMVLSHSVEQAKVELAGGGLFAERMMRAIDAALISMLGRVAASPHGAELLDLKSSLADLIVGWRMSLAGHLCRAVGNEAHMNGIDLAAKGLSAEMLVDMLLDALDGMKVRITDPGEQRVVAAAQIAVIGLVLKA